MHDAPRVRIAPSPTGALHIGTARAALFNYLFARRFGGTFILRIEDTDLERSDKKYEQEIFDGLQWLGIVPDEGPVEGGPYAPYRQTERVGFYQKYIERLLKEGKAFYCFHSAEDLAQEKDQLMAEKRPPLHLCEFRTLDPDQAKLLTETKSDYIIRFKTPTDRTITFADVIRGEVRFDSSLLGDFSIAKQVNVPLYNFAVVADDIEMDITHVIRGEDHIPNTPKQLLLFDALGKSPPRFAHLPLILGPDRSKLSKRHGAVSLQEYKKYYPEALFNYLALLGWNPGGNQEIFSKEELIREFSLEKVQKSGAIFDPRKLEWMNGEYHKKYLQERGPRKIAEYLKAEMPEYFITDINTTARAITLEGPRMKDFTSLKDSNIDHASDYGEELLVWKNMSKAETQESLDRSMEILRSINDPYPNRTDLEKIFLREIGEGDKGSVLWPLRVALTGKKASPGPFEIIEIIGIKEALKRLLQARSKLEQ